MIGLARDTWRAVLVVVVAVLLREMFAERPAAPAPPVAWQPAPPPTVATPMMMPAGWQQPEPRRPLRRVGAAFVELAESVIGVVR
jgi:hypothetical protein